MRRYIEITIGGKRYRFLIDEELDKELKSSLKDKYKFNSDNLLVVSDEDLINSYEVKQLILKAILNQINSYDMDADMQKKIDTLRSYVGKKTTIYSSDLSKLESILGEASELYNNVRNSLPKKEEVRETVKDSLNEIKDVIQNLDYQNDNLNSTTSSTNDKLDDFKAIVEEISLDEDLKDKIPVDDINDAMDRVVICSSVEEFIDKTGNNVDSYDITSAIKNKSTKIILPPNTKLEDVATEILKTCINDNTTMEKVVTIVEKRASYKSKTDGALESLRSSLKVYGLSSRNLNYFGDQFFDAFEAICKESGISFESMFADYFNSYSANRRYNSPMDKFIRLFNKFNGGDDNTRALLEAMLVKKAISRHLISTKYNRYLKDEYRNLNVNGSGYINFNEDSFRRTVGGIGASAVSGIQAEQTIQTEAGAHIGENEHSYETDLNIGSKVIQDSKTQNQISSLPETENDILMDTSLDEASVNFRRAQQRKNGIGAIQERTAGIASTQEETSIRLNNGRMFTSNNALNPSLLAEEEELAEEQDIGEEDSESEDADNVGDNEESFGSSLGGAEETDNESSDISPSDEGEGASPLNDLADAAKDTVEDAVKDAAKKGIKKAIIEFLKKNPWTWLIIGIIILVLFLLLIIIASSDDMNKNSMMGYYDSACNFNDVRVTIKSCTTTEDLQRLDLKDYVTRMTYLYTKNGNYSDETIKALMIILKTNALSYGGYTSSSKNVDVRICDAYNGTFDETSLFSGAEENLDKLNELYEQISEYLYISSSYKSSITSLNSVNAITINDSTLTSLENAATNGSNYGEILNSVFKVETEENITVSDARENLFLGDSRTQGILNTGVINDNNTVYGVGYGYNWLVGSSGFTGTTNASNGGINGINSKITAGKNYNIIIWLGVNDLGNANSYLEKYKELASGEWSSHNLYVVSVGPVQDSKSRYAKNDTIQTFNTTIKEGITNANLDNLKYIDLGYTESSINTYDNAGVHYGSDDYRSIYNKITSSLTGYSGPTSISTKLSLYRLGDYCTYYNLTENDAYWWPIGSAEPTNGNIYGGTPTTTYISSYFGPRVINGKESVHKGIDISGGSACFSNVIIASKSGTVIEASDTCPTMGSYGNTCGGSYGNYVIIDHGDGTSTVYAHMTSGSVVVKKGDVVSQGQKIGIMGSSGSSTGCHLHFEVRVGGTKMNPLNYVKQDNLRPVNTINISVTGDGNGKNMVCSSLLASGFSKEATIGIMANLAAESGYSSINVQDSYESRIGYNDSTYTLAVDNGSYTKFSGDSVGYGLAQWTSAGRKLKLYNYAKEKNVSIGNFEMQFNFMMNELQNSYANTYKYVTGNHSALDTGAYWCDHYESPGGSEACSKHGNCPSQHCVNRTNNYISSHNLVNYVNNGCKE